MTPSPDLPEQGDPRIEAALPEVMDYLPDHPCRQERVARACLERVFAAVDAMSPEQGDPADERIEQLEREKASLRLELDGARHCHRADNEHLLARALRAEEALRQLLEEAEGMSDQIHQQFCVGCPGHESCEPEALKIARHVLDRLPIPTGENE